MVFRFLLAFLIGICVGLANAHAAQPSGAATLPLEAQLVQRELAKDYPGARVELLGPIRWASGALQGRVSAISNVFESGAGEAIFTAVLAGGAIELARGTVPFAAWVPAWVATRRILPGEALSPDFFSQQQVNVAVGMAHEDRGILYPSTGEISGLQSRQTVMEGQFLVSSAVERVPDIRRGEPVRILMSTGNLQMTTLGVAEEPGYLNGEVRVMTRTTKRELVGLLRDGGVVEVSL